MADVIYNPVPQYYVVAEALGPKGDNGSLWYTGNGIPASSLGVINDLYLDLDNSNLYKKLEAGWTYQTNLKGEQGEDGPIGSGLTIADEGVSLTPRSVLNFIGEGVEVTDDGTNLNVTITATGTGTGDRSIDGGSASTIYLPLQNIDGGNASSVYSATQLIDGGNA